jgi:hypothetical protein
MSSHLVPPRRDELAVTGQQKLSLRHQQYLEDIAVSIGDESDQVDINTANIATNTTNIATNTTAINAINSSFGDLVVITTDYTTTGTDRIICNNSSAATVTLRSSPGDDEKVYIKRLTSQVTIDGNGNTIDGDSTLVLTRDYTSVLLTYSSVIDAWFIM